jgi:hypothetical protein
MLDLAKHAGRSQTRLRFRATSRLRRFSLFADHPRIDVKRVTRWIANRLLRFWWSTERRLIVLLHSNRRFPADR